MHSLSFAEMPEQHACYSAFWEILSSGGLVKRSEAWDSQTVTPTSHWQQCQIVFFHTSGQNILAFTIQSLEGREKNTNFPSKASAVLWKENSKFYFKRVLTDFLASGLVEWRVQGWMLTRAASLPALAAKGGCIGSPWKSPQLHSVTREGPAPFALEAVQLSQGPAHCRASAKKWEDPSWRLRAGELRKTLLVRVFFLKNEMLAFKPFILIFPVCFLSFLWFPFCSNILLAAIYG